MFPALVIFAGFIVAGIFVSKIAQDAYKINTVRIQSGHDIGRCGITLRDFRVESRAAFAEQSASDTRAAVAYARSCYSPATAVANSVACSRFTKEKLQYTRHPSDCPFGDLGQPFEQSICHFNGNPQAHRLRTVLVDSHEDLGINAPPANRVQLVKELTCSPLNTEGFTSRGVAYGSEASPNNVTVTNYNYGATPNVQDYTYRYNTAAKDDNVPFEVYTLLANSTPPQPWVPVENLTRKDADVTIVFIAPNSINFREQVKDPVFQAKYCNRQPTTDEERSQLCRPDFEVSVIGCTEQYSICNSQRSSEKCTKPDGQGALPNNIQSLNLNLAQLVTAYRMIYMINNGNTWSSIYGLGPDSLQIWNRVFNLIAPGVPEDQWKIEVQGWMETTLAKWQAYMVQYAINTVKPDNHSYIGFPVINSTLNVTQAVYDREWENQCLNQKISNLGAYQNISVFGLAFTWAASLAIIIFPWIFKSIVAKWGNMPKSKARRNAWNIDGKLQQQRVALRSVGYDDLVGGNEDVPYLEVEARLPLPFRVSEDNSQVSTIFKSSTTPTTAVGSAVASAVNATNMSVPAPQAGTTVATTGATSRPVPPPQVVTATAAGTQPVPTSVPQTVPATTGAIAYPLNPPPQMRGSSAATSTAASPLNPPPQVRGSSAATSAAASPLNPPPQVRGSSAATSATASPLNPPPQVRGSSAATSTAANPLNPPPQVRGSSVATSTAANPLNPPPQIRGSSAATSTAANPLNSLPQIQGSSAATSTAASPSSRLPQSPPAGSSPPSTITSQGQALHSESFA